MRSDNGNKTMKLNRFLSKPAVMPLLICGLDFIYFFFTNYAVNSIRNLREFLHDSNNPMDYLGIKNIFPRFADAGELVMYIYIILAVVLVILDIKMIWQIRSSFSEADLNYGQEGTSRWTTLDEIKKQYKAVPEKDETFKGKGGTVISRWKNLLYIDDIITNNLDVGTSRSGKTEMKVFQSIDVHSRAEKIENRPSMIIGDPKLELYKSSKGTLEKRGYTVRLLNIDNPLKSMGYNPLQLVIDHFKNGKPERAQMAAKTFAFSIFNADASTQEAIWKNTATDLFTALIIAVVTDCMDADKLLNNERKTAYDEKSAAFLELDIEQQEAARTRFQTHQETSGKDIFLDRGISFIPNEVQYFEIFENEKKANCFSCINFFKELCDRAAAVSEDAKDFEKKAETALDDYFNARPKLDYAAGLYNEIKTAGDRTKGSVYINMQSAVSTFSLENIAKMTAENDVDIKDLGYGDKPVAIFMGIPSEDRSNHFLAVTFIGQIYQYLFQLSKQTKGKLDRNVKFILDEFGNLPPVENFAGFVTVCLSLGISFDISVQSYNQIKATYGNDTDTILENFANQTYIMSVGNESAEKFSDMLGNRTVIDVQRSGKRMEFNKSITEAPKQQPLMYPQELSVLRPGECVVYRGTKRQDRLGVAIRSYPIINEYADKLSFVTEIKIICHMIYFRIIKKQKMKHPTDEDHHAVSWTEERHMRRGSELRNRGTALKFRYEYLTDTFPNPSSIDFNEMCTESREHIDYENRILDPEEVLRFLSSPQKIEEKRNRMRQGSSKTEVCFYNAKCYRKVAEILCNTLGNNWEKMLDIAGRDAMQTVFDKLCNNDEIEIAVKQSVLWMIKEEM